MPPETSGQLRIAKSNDQAQLIRLWALSFVESGAEVEAFWESHAGEWFSQYVDDHASARFPVIEVGGDIVATAIGTLEVGPPNPWCPRGRIVRLANVFTLPDHRDRGYGTALVIDVIEWARSISADRVDLSATEGGERVYQRLGFLRTTAPRMKLVL